MYVLYDGDCLFCCNIVKRILLLFDNNNVSFHTFKSLEGRELISLYSLKNLNSVIYINNKSKIFFKASAVLNICRLLKFPYNFLYVFNVFPNSFLDIIYIYIAKRRMFWGNDKNKSAD